MTTTAAHAEQRRGRIGASDFRTIVEGGQRAWQRLAERIKHERAGGPLALDDVDRKEAHATRWGKSYEAEARRMTGLVLGRTIVWNVGFISAEPALGSEFAEVGCSPDGLIAHKTNPGRWDQGLEIKCPYNEQEHAKVRAFGMPAIYRWQVQGSMWVTGCGSWLFASYDPRGAGDLYTSTIERDRAACEKIERKVRGFLGHLGGDCEYFPRGARGDLFEIEHF